MRRNSQKTGRIVPISFRPRKILDTNRIAQLRAQDVGWKRIAAEMEVGIGTIYRVALDGSKIREKVF